LAGPNVFPFHKKFNDRKCNMTVLKRGADILPTGLAQQEWLSGTQLNLSAGIAIGEVSEADYSTSRSDESRYGACRHAIQILAEEPATLI
jgi:hypothetical protein